MVRKLLVASLVALLLPLSAHAAKELVDPEPVPVTGKLSAADLEKIVKVSLIERGWQVKDAGSGKKEALLAKRDYEVRIQVTYNPKEIAIKYLDSTGLDYKEEDGKRTIHKNYARWIENLVRDFNTRMTRAEFAK